MDWEPVETYLKSGPCTLPTFYTPWNMTTELETWVGSNTDFGTLAAYGLPTTNGLIGGTAATPKQPPTYAFQMNGPGIAFVISTVCMSPKPIPYPNTTHTSSLIISDQFWGEMYSVGLQLRFPAGTHAWKQYSHQDITQTCQLDLVFGAADITFAYISDVWGSISPSGLKEIKINEDIVITPDNSVQFDFGTLHLAFGATEQLYQNLTASVREGIRILLNDSDMVSVVTRGDTASSLIWGLNEDGLYDPAKTWNALSGAVAVISHYVLDQNDNTESSVCEFRGLAGWGKIASPLWATWTVNSLVLVGFVMEIIVLASWLVVVGGGEHIDRCIAMIDKPLRTIYYMRESAGRLVTKIRGKDIGDISLHQHLEKVKVRFGEDKRTRGEEVGTLILAEPSRVVKASRHRKLV
ncbi:hypothetical protein BCR33DRAFT_733770 [Rhizoclosmatium globosum]|uniref:Uncharacterized protein n=1 Tax=Rhizoclosmatium globosum TaxID=329046 RepID=A0A1Y2CWQ9_9FUNG|nr:hypothetical protein BCR33DRAFT_733770 [Rhizoclosmatium globosum]|eukprot:ORY51469.1 hypothetical protein BCR33DRAFT_733770 [Rhizoclosmatium globosum]